MKATTLDPVSDADAAGPTDSSRSPDGRAKATGQATAPLPSQANDRTAALVPIDVFCGQVPAIQPQHQTAAKVAPAKQHARQDLQVPEQLAVASLKPVVPSLGSKHSTEPTASKLDKPYSASAIPARRTTAGYVNINHDQQQS